MAAQTGNQVICVPGSRVVMPDLFRHPQAALFDVYRRWIPGQARNDGLYSPPNKHP
jgi:hypothetical protein